MRTVVKIPSGECVHKTFDEATVAGSKQMTRYMSGRLNQIFYTVTATKNGDVIKPGKFIYDTLIGMYMKSKMEKKL